MDLTIGYAEIGVALFWWFVYIKRVFTLKIVLQKKQLPRPILGAEFQEKRAILENRVASESLRLVKEQRMQSMLLDSLYLELKKSDMQLEMEYNRYQEKIEFLQNSISRLDVERRELYLVQKNPLILKSLKSQGGIKKE